MKPNLNNAKNIKLFANLVKNDSKSVLLRQKLVEVGQNKYSPSFAKE
jgi:hypothetical protein